MDALATNIEARVNAIDWHAVEEEPDGFGCATVKHMLTPVECDALSALYARDALYRSRVVMARHGFGRGEYKYYAYPLPEVIGALRESVYPHLVGIANRWNEIMRIDTCYPPDHADFIDRCHAAGQLRPTPRILQYAQGDYNCLHQDLYRRACVSASACHLAVRAGT